MKVIRNAESYISPKPLSICIGNFDGFHLGHRLIADDVLKKAADLGASPAVVTFEFSKNDLLTTTEEKLELFRETGFKKVLILKGNDEWMNWSKSYFTDSYLAHNLKAVSVTVGRDFRYGKDREGDVATLKSSLPDRVKIIDLKKSDGKKISSTLIREELIAGNLSEVAKLLGRDYFFLGNQVRGEGDGKKLGYPTINFSVLENKLLPLGVFTAEVILDSSLKKSGVYGACYIGDINVVGLKKRRRTVEIHLLGAKRPEAMKPIGVRLLKTIRKPLSFGSKNQLVEKIALDIEKIKVDINHREL
ncbi:MAG: hypothetical protein GX817_05685 [Elusimicrobia bacterium]|nr:hypothetical protein [Elusimicrobiota bacterium]